MLVEPGARRCGSQTLYARLAAAARAPQLAGMASAYMLLCHALLTGEWAGLSESLGPDPESDRLRVLIGTLAGHTSVGYAPPY